MSLLDHLLPTVMWVWVMLNLAFCTPYVPWDEGGSKGDCGWGLVLWSFSVSCGYLQSKMLNLQVLQPLQKKKNPKTEHPDFELLKEISLSRL